MKDQYYQNLNENIFYDEDENEEKHNKRISSKIARKKPIVPKSIPKSKSKTTTRKIKVKNEKFYSDSDNSDNDETNGDADDECSSDHDTCNNNNGHNDQSIGICTRKRKQLNFIQFVDDEGFNRNTKYFLGLLSNSDSSNNDGGDTTTTATTTATTTTTTTTTTSANTSPRGDNIVINHPDDVPANYVKFDSSTFKCPQFYKSFSNTDQLADFSDSENDIRPKKKNKKPAVNTHNTGNSITSASIATANSSFKFTPYSTLSNNESGSNNVLVFTKKLKALLKSPCSLSSSSSSISSTLSIDSKYNVYQLSELLIKNQPATIQQLSFLVNDVTLVDEYGSDILQLIIEFKNLNSLIYCHDFNNKE